MQADSGSAGGLVLRQVGSQGGGSSDHGGAGSGGGGGTTHTIQVDQDGQIIGKVSCSTLSPGFVFVHSQHA